MNKQKTFNKVARHLLEQGERASDMGTCRYRDGNGRSCAVGCLIPDDEYTPGFEGDIVSFDEGVSVPLIVKYLKSRGFNLELLGDLQDLHDGVNPEDWIDGLRRVAVRHRLMVTTLDAITGS